MKRRKQRTENKSEYKYKEPLTTGSQGKAHSPSVSLLSVPNSHLS